MKTVATALVLLAASAKGFAPAAPTVRRVLSATQTDQDDFDAPSNRAAAVGNVVQAKKPSVFGVAIPSFIAKAFGVRYEGEKVSDIDDDRMESMLLEIDEECYLGKDGDLEECADFDP